MANRNIILLAITGCLWLGCQKPTVVKETADCQKLEHGITTGNIEEVETVINAFIASLPSQTYTEENLNKLVTAIGEQCGTSVTLFCFDCIKTLPSQSEIKISYFGTDGPVEKTIDLNYTTSNKMAFNNMHE
ncbi:MAG: hypothetical protein ABI675_00245 [Chitinophagaceae bacterium]